MYIVPWKTDPDRNCVLLKRASSENLHSVFLYPGCLPTGTQSSVLARGMIYLKPCDEQRLSSGVSLQFFISFIWSSKIMVSCFILSLWEKSHEISLSIFSVHWLMCVIQFSSAMCLQNSSSCLPPDTTIHSFFCNFEIWFLSTFYPKFTIFVPWILTIFLFLMATQVFLTVVWRTFLCKLFHFIGCNFIRI